jgi:hypothetical protein
MAKEKRLKSRRRKKDDEGSKKEKQLEKRVTHIHTVVVRSHTQRMSFVSVIEKKDEERRKKKRQQTNIHSVCTCVCQSKTQKEKK